MVSPQGQGNGALFGGAFGEYRYRLWRTWDAERPRLLWVLLNPSMADARRDDPTVRRCISFSRAAGYGGLEMVNLFAFRATDPHDLRRAPDPIGPHNDHHITTAAKEVAGIVVAWGEQGVYRGRERAVLALLARQATRPLLCLGTVRNGCPCHPLRLSGSANLAPYLYPKSVT